MSSSPLPTMESPATRVSQRPGYHFLPPANWMNDPNGLIRWNGVYHMFYQYNPEGAFWKAPHWGHATSTDLVHWNDLPIALAPEVGGYDEQGCWSGCAVDNNGVPTIIYTGVSNGQQRPCLATSHDGMNTWQKYDGNPIIAAPPDLNLIAFRGDVAFRDHAVWREDGHWLQLIGAGIRGEGGTALLYDSPDLINWTFLHPLHVGDLRQSEPVATGLMWECPQLVQFGDQHGLIVSVYDGTTRYTIGMTGTYADQQFTPKNVQKIDYGDNYFYAPQSLIEPDGRVLMWGWLQEGRSGEAQREAGWSGVMSLPREVSVASDGTWRFAPARELVALRTNPRTMGATAIDDTVVALPQVEGAMLELHAVIDPGTATTCGIGVRCSPDQAERTFVVYNRNENWIGINAVQASHDPAANNEVRGGPFTLAPNEPLDLRIFVDQSVIEVFANGRACLTGRVYPTRDDSVCVVAVASGGAATLTHLDAWTLRSIWDERRALPSHVSA
jgi:beta-fructofuranosidase